MANGDIDPREIERLLREQHKKSFYSGVGTVKERLRGYQLPTTERIIRGKKGQIIRIERHTPGTKWVQQPQTKKARLKWAKTSSQLTRGLHLLIPTVKPLYLREGGKLHTTGYGRPGRPRQSYKHIIPGQGSVDIYTYRKWARRQAALQRLQLAEQLARVQQIRRITPSMLQQMQQANVQASQFEDVSQFEPEMASEQQIQEFAQQMPTPTQMPQQSATFPQSNSQQMPNFMAPMSRNTPMVSAPMRPTFLGSGNILHAPNPWKGELRNVGNRHPVDANVVNRPITNPMGDNYTDIDPFTGKSILKMRPRERWLN